MILKQYYLGCLAHASYMIADEATKTAAIVDPQRDVDQYVRDAEELGLAIRHVLLTHFHADFLAGHLELRDRFGATIYLGARAEAEFEFTPLRDGDSVRLGSVRLTALETPGHTPEGISLLVFDESKDKQKPHAVLTGDTLFIGDVGRPDLMASVGVSAEELAGMLYDSLHAKLLTLPDETLVYPAHGAGSMCGKRLSTETVSTIGDQRKYNYALQPMSREEFIQLVAADQPEAPDYFGYDAMLNRKERPTLEASLARSLRPMSVDDVEKAAREGAQLLDAREAADYAGGHWKGSLNIGLSGQYATWAGTLLRPDAPIVLVADPGKETEAAMRLGRIGFDNVVGFLAGGVLSLQQRPDLIQKTERITALTVQELAASEAPPVILDVRTDQERRAGRIAGSLHIPLNELRGRLAELPKDRPIVVHCQGGYRSSAACGLLESAGFHRCLDLVGGFKAWQAARLPVEQNAGAACAGPACRT
jgi:glyoxylase-like metal-dependent hydrolase (beta-lactamase superfamily II)/rhodanese-related sulfurtransferase